MTSKPFRAAVVGCRMGAAHARALAELPEFELAALCDLHEETARAAAAETGSPSVYSDYRRMLEEIKPEVVAVATPTAMHMEHVLQAVAAGAKGVCCEKPMAVNLRDAREIVAACGRDGVALIVNHQRRMGADLIEARRLIEKGALGPLEVIRGNCAGDMLSDGTHLIDSLLWLAGDEPAEWVFGQVHREPGPAPGEGYRYGHPVENGALAVVRLRNGLRLELATGDMHPDCRIYQDYEIVGEQGRIWRTGDKIGANLFIQDDKGGGWIAGKEDWAYKPVPATGGRPGTWRPVPVPADAPAPMQAAYRQFAAMLARGESHPMAGEVALRGFEVVMAVYESARLRRKLRLPLAQERFPLELMMEEGVFAKQ